MIDNFAFVGGLGVGAGVGLVVAMVLISDHLKVCDIYRSILRRKNEQMEYKDHVAEILLAMEDAKFARIAELRAVANDGNWDEVCLVAEEILFPDKSDVEAEELA